MNDEKLSNITGPDADMFRQWNLSACLRLNTFGGRILEKFLPLTQIKHIDLVTPVVPHTRNENVRTRLTKPAIAKFAGTQITLQTIANGQRMTDIA